MKKHIIYFLLSFVLSVGIWTRFEYMLVLSAITTSLLLFSSTCGSINDNISKILKNKFNWILLAITLIVIVSLCNPNGIFIQEDGYYYIKKIPYIEYLPTSISIFPSERGSYYFILFLLNIFNITNTYILTTKTKQDINLFFIYISIFGFICANTIILMTIYNSHNAVETSGRKLLGIIEAYMASPTGTFFSQNMASQYMILILSATISLFIQNLKEVKTAHNSTYIIVFGIFIIFDIIALVLCIQLQAFIGIVVLTLTLIAEVFHIILKQRRNFIYLLSVIIALGTVTYIFIPNNQLVETLSTQISNKLERKITETHQDKGRIALWCHAYNLFEKNKYWGIGVNNFYFYSYQYDKEYYIKQHPQKVSKSISYSAHNDLLQLLCEFGIFGSTIFFVGMVYFLILLSKRITSQYPYKNTLVGILLVAIISLFDMPFQLINVSCLFILYSTSILLYYSIDTCPRNHLP